MAIGFPVVVNGSEHPHVFEIRASLQEKIPPEIWFQGFDQRVLFDSAYKSVFDRQKQNVRLDLFANVALTFIPNENSTLFIGQSAKAALLLASYFRCNELSNILVSARCDLKVWPPDCEIVPLGTDSKAAIKVEAHRFGHTLFMHEADLAGIQSIEPEQWDRNGALPQIVRIRPGTTLRQLAEILQVRPFDAVWRAAGVVPVGEGLVDRAVARILNQRTQHFHGRDAAMSTLDAWLQTATEGTRLVLAPAGVGKSALLANWIEHRRRQGDDVVQHFFAHRAPETTEVEPVLDYLWRQLEARSGSASTPSPHQVADLLGAELARPQSRRLILVLDGLDEADDFKCFLPATLGTNVYVVLGVRSDGSGRIPKTAWRWLHEQAPVEPLHLAALDSEAMRAWLLAERPELAGASVDPWLRQLKAVSDGIPLFLRHVFDDLRATPRDAPLPQLPASFADYLQADLDWMLASHRTDWWQLLALLTCTRGPIARSELALLKDEKGNRPFCELSSKPEELRILRWLSRTGEDRNPRYSFIHPRFATAFAEVLPEDLIERVRQWLVAHAGRWLEPKLDYALQWGLQHQVEAGQSEAALTLMRNLDFHCLRIERFPEVDLLGASLRLVQRLPRTAEDRRWLSGLAQCTPLLSTGAVTERAGLLRGLAEDFLGVEGPRDRPIRLMKPEVLQPSALVAVLQGHTGPVVGATLLPDQRILSWSKDGTLRLWDADGTPQAVLISWVHGALVISDEHILSWHNGANGCEDTLELWSTDGEFIKASRDRKRWHNYTQKLPVAVTGGREGWVLSISDDRFIYWKNNNTHFETMHLWDSKKTIPISIIKDHAGRVDGALFLSKDRFLSWSAGGRQLQLWDSNDGMLIKIFEGHNQSIRGALIASGDRLLSWSYDNTLRLWNSNNGTLIAVLEGHTDLVNDALAFSENRLLSWSKDCTLRLWDSTNGTLITVFEGHAGSVNGALLISDSRMISSSEDGTVRLWDLKDGILIAIFEKRSDWFFRPPIFADNRKVIIGKDHTLWLLDSSDTPISVFAGHADKVKGALIVSDNRLLSWSADHTLRLWDLTAGFAGDLEDAANRVLDALIVSDNRLLSWSDNHALQLWNSTDGTLIAVLQGHTSSVHGALVVPGNRLLSWSADCTLRLWDSNNGKIIKVFNGHMRGVHGALIVSDDRVISWSRSTMLLWDLNGGLLLKSLSDYNYGTTKSILTDFHLVTWSKHLGDVTLWPLDSIGDVPRKTLNEYYFDSWDALAISDNRLLAWGDKTLRLWDLTDGLPIAVLEGHTDCVRGALIIPGNCILSWSYDRTLRLWDSADGKPISVLEDTSFVNGALVVSNNHILSWSCDGALRMRDYKNSSTIAIFKGHAADVNGAFIISDNILSWSDDGTLRLWNLSGRALAAWAQPYGKIYKVVQVSPNRVAVLAGSHLMFVDIG